MAKPTKQEAQLPLTQPSTNLVELVIPTPAPITDGGTMLDRVRNFAVTTPNDYTEMANIRQNARARWAAVEKQRETLKAPSLEAGRRIDAFFKPILSIFEEAAKIATDKLGNYDAEQRKIAAEKQRQADEEARIKREAAEAAAREEAAKQAEIRLQQELAEAQQKIDQERQRREAAEADAATERSRREAAEAASAGDQERVLAAEAEAAQRRKEAVAARMAQLKAEEDAAEQKRIADEAIAQSQQRAQEQADIAATTVAPVIEAELTSVSGLSRAKTYTWKLLDKSKLKPEYLLVDEKAINALVRSTRHRAAEMVGVGAIEIVEETNLRQSK